jgi:hypothetical protein
MKNAHDVDKFIKLLNDLKVLEQRLGVNNVYNIVGKLNGLEAEVKRLTEIKEWFIERTGTRDIGQAKSRVNALLNKDEAVDATSLPDVFHKPAAIWLTGRPKSTLSKDDKGFPPLRVRDAELQHRGVLPWLLEAWTLADTYSNGEEVRDELVKRYLSTTPDEFTRLCYMHIHDMEEPELHVELNRQIEKNASTFEVSKSLRAVTDTDYGVGGTLEPPTWDD